MGAKCHGHMVSSFVFPIWYVTVTNLSPESGYVMEVFHDLSHSLHGSGKIVPSSLPFILLRFFLYNFSHTWIDFCHTACCCILEDGILLSYSCETLIISHLPYRLQLFPPTSFPTWDWWHNSVPYSLSYWMPLSNPWISTRVYCWPCKSFGTQFCKLWSYNTLINYNWEIYIAIPTLGCCTCSVSLWRSGQWFSWLCVEILHELFYGHWCLCLVSLLCINWQPSTVRW